MHTEILLFIGIESHAWGLSDFQAAARFCKANDIDGLLVKVFDGQQGDWYGGIGGYDAVHQVILGQGRTSYPYYFGYGNNKGSSLDGEAHQGIGYGQRYGTVCANLESSWDGQGDWGAHLATLLQQAKAQKEFTFWLSTWANVVSHNWTTSIGHLAGIVDGWMPEVYNASLYQAMSDQFPQSVKSKLMPTFEISLAEFGSNAPWNYASDFVSKHHPTSISLWEYNWAIGDPNSVKKIVSAVRAAEGGVVASVGIKTNNGAVVDLVKSFQLDGGSQDKCGPWSVSELHYAGLPGHGPAGNSSQVQQWAHAEYEKYIGPDVPSDQNGSSVENMHSFLHDAGLHYWDIPSINPGSTKASDLSNIYASLNAGYPVLVTVNEQSVIRPDGSNPYPWQPRLGPVNHVFTIVGHTPGWYLVADELNQGDSWPDHYSEDRLEIHWACVVQLVGPDANNPWLAPIPSGTPTSWPAGFNAQNFVPKPPPPVPPKPPVDPLPGFQREADDAWGAHFMASANTIQQFNPQAIGTTLPDFIPPKGTGIYNDWFDRWKNKGQVLGSATTWEYDTVNGSGKAIKAQHFEYARCEWDGSAKWFDAHGQITP